MNKNNADKVEWDIGDSLVVIDMQNDFLRGGSLAVPEGDQVIPVLNGYRLGIDQRIPSGTGGCGLDQSPNLWL